MKIIMLATPKGGGGKSTASITLANTLRYEHGKSVWLISTDPQGSPNLLRNEDLEQFPDREEDSYPISLLTPEDFYQSYVKPDVPGGEFWPNKREMAKEIDYIILDTQGTMDAKTYDIARSVDLILIPVKLSRMDLSVWFNTFSEIVTSQFTNYSGSSYINPNLQIRWYPNQYKKNAMEYTSIQENKEVFEEQSGVKVLLPGLPDRVDFVRIDTLKMPENIQSKNMFIRFTDQALELLGETKMV